MQKKSKLLPLNRRNILWNRYINSDSKIKLSFEMFVHMWVKNPVNFRYKEFKDGNIQYIINS